MKYAINYDRDFRHYDTVDEVLFSYEIISNHIDIISKTLTKEEQLCIINLAEVTLNDDIIHELIKLKEVHNNILFQIKWETNDINLMKTYKLPYMFIDYAKTIETVYAMCRAGASEIYIVEELGFKLPQLQFYRERYNVKLRVFPDIAQCGKHVATYINPLTKFFIRPEDTDLYEDLIDVFEIFRSDDRTSVVYEVYRQRQWLGNLNQLIIDLKLSIINTSIVPHFGQCRINCNKRCYEERCNICPEIEKLSYSFDDAGLEIIKKRRNITEDMTQEEKEKILNNLKKEEDNEFTTN